MLGIKLSDVSEFLKGRGFAAGGAALDLAIAAYQRWHGLKPTGQLDADTVASMLAPRFCGHPDVMPLAEALQAWPRKDLSYTITNPGGFPGLSADQAKAAFAWAAGQIEAACDVRLRWTPDAAAALIVIDCQRIDQPGGVLAYSELADGTARRKGQRYDSSEAWVYVQGPQVPRSRIDLGRVALHELIHMMGVPHLPSGNLMQPLYDMNIWTPQSGDVRELVARYGPPAAPPPPAPPEGEWLMEVRGTGPVPQVKVTRVPTP